MTNSTTENPQPTTIETLIHRFSESAQITSNIGDEVSRKPLVLEYDRVAAQFYEDTILRLRKELLKYRAQAQFAFRFESSGDDLSFSADEPSAITREFRKKITRVTEDADHIPEEL
jgi:hypothetical protein